MIASVLLLLAVAPPDDAPERVAEHVEVVDEQPRTYVSFRVGAATNVARPQLCLDAMPFASVGIEACGTGGGFLHDDPGADISHFRGKVRLAAAEVEGAWVEPFVAFGFAELELGGDLPGFTFDGTSAGVSTAGPDVGASVRALLPLGAGVELIGEVGVGLAFFAHAPSLVVPQDPVQTQATVHLGVGF